MNVKRGLFLAILMMITTAGAAVATSLPDQVGLSTIGGPWRGTMDRADLSSLVRELGSMHGMGRSDLS